VVVISLVDKQNKRALTVMTTAGNDSGGPATDFRDVASRDRPTRVVRRPARYRDSADDGNTAAAANDEQPAAIAQLAEHRPTHDQSPNSKIRTRRHKRLTCKLLESTAPTAMDLSVNGWTPEFLEGEQRTDPDIGPAFSWAITRKPDWEAVRSGSPALCALYQQWDSVVTINGVLYRCFYNSDASIRYYQFIVPRSL
jgi:hypothetical protein